MSPALLLAALLAPQPAAATAATPAVPPPAPPAPAAAPAQQTEWPFRFGDYDYPARALRNYEQGTTRYRVEIGGDGLVSRCTITGSSGSSILDSETCRMVTARARFTPARDSAGNPVTDTREAEVTWLLGDDSYKPGARRGEA